MCFSFFFPLPLAPATNQQPKRGNGRGVGNVFFAIGGSRFLVPTRQAFAAFCTYTYIPHGSCHPHTLSPLVAFCCFCFLVYILSFSLPIILARDLFYLPFFSPWGVPFLFCASVLVSLPRANPHCGCMSTKTCDGRLKREDELAREKKMTLRGSLIFAWAQVQLHYLVVISALPLYDYTVTRKGSIVSLPWCSTSWCRDVLLLRWCYTWF